ncbi:MAG: DUF3109 family protein [Chitinophagales bacterium]
MILIDDKIISDDIVTEQFVCNLQVCKGKCCIEGDGGAPLEATETQKLTEIFPIIANYLTEQARAEIERQGLFVPSEENNEMVTPLVDGGACVYLNFDEKGIAKCQIERAWEEGKTDFQKPISCHLYPIRAEKHRTFTALNYYYWDICASACSLGKSLKVPVYKFLKEPLIRAYGEDFYEQLEGAAAHVEK